MISFVIPTLNEESVIEKTLRWISSYSQDKEIIISDGKSQDATVEIAKKYTDKIVIYDKPKRQTIGQARNMGAELAQKDYIVFVDADVIIFDPDDFFSKAIALMDATPDSVALTAFMRVLPEAETFADKIFYGMVNYSYMFYNNVLGTGGASGEFQMVRRDAFRKAGGFDEILIGGEDHEHFRRLAKIGRTIFATDLTIYHTGRRPHKIGWPRLLLTWAITILPMSIRTLFLKEWTQVR